MGVLVTGGTGTLGYHLLSVITRSKGQLTSLAHSDSVPHRYLAHVTYEKGDLLDSARLLEIVRRCKPSEVYHLAAQSSVGISQKRPLETLTANVLGTQNLLEVIRKVVPDCRVMLLSSSDVYGAGEGLLDVLHDETDPFRPLTPFASSKACMEILGQQYRRAFGLHVVVARPFNYTGPGHSRRFVLPSVAEQLVRIRHHGAEPIVYTGNLDVSRDVTDVRDLSRALVLVMNTAASGSVYNICCGKVRTIRDLVELMIDQQHLEVELRRDPARERQVELPMLVGSPELLMRDTTWKPMIRIEDTLMDIYREMETRLDREKSQGVDYRP
jgi:GDP-4-dehydro-6-deoxy-D-mannose reductase